MDAANPLGRCLLLAVGLAAVMGCQTERASQIAPIAPVASNVARGQLPQPVDPLAPIAPIAPPPPVAGAPIPYTPIAPLAPPKPDGLSVVPALGGGKVSGSPVPPDTKSPGVKTAGFTAPKLVSTTADLLRVSEPRIRVVATVGANNVITDQEVTEAVYQLSQDEKLARELASLDGHARAAKQKELYAQVLRKTIERELILDEMYAKLKKANKMTVIDEIKDYATQSTDRQMRAFRTASKAKSDEEFAAMLRADGLTVQVVRRQMERQEMAAQYINSALKEKGRRTGLGEIRDYYDRHPDEFQTPDRVKWQHLFVATKNYATPRAAYDRAAAFWQQAANGVDFGALAVQYDEGFAKQQKGFGTGEKRKEIQPADLEETIWSLKPGQISVVIPTPTGYHVVKIVERDYAGVQPFDTTVQGKIRDKLSKANTEAEYKKLIEELWRKGVVQVFPE